MRVPHFNWTRVACLFGVGAGIGMALAQSELRETKTAMQGWVETRRLIGQERSDWVTEKESIEQTIQLYEKRVADLAAEIDEASQSNRQAIRETQELESEKAALIEAAVAAGQLIGEAESSIKVLAQRLPQPVREKIEPFFRRIPENPDETKASLSQRMQNIVGIINELEKFNGALAVFSELRKNSQGQEVQVKTLYLGLGQAYFVDKAEAYAGIGTPGTGGGWDWAERSELASTIAEAIAVYENAKPAAFVSLPVEVE